MDNQPKRELSLEEWVVRLPPDHKARSELVQLEDAVRDSRIENAALKRLLTEAKPLLEPYPIQHFSVTHSMYSDLWERVDALLTGEKP